MHLPGDDRYGEGRYTVQCDADEVGVVTYVPSVRLLAPEAPARERLESSYSETPRVIEGCDWKPMQMEKQISSAASDGIYAGDLEELEKLRAALANSQEE